MRQILFIINCFVIIPVEGWVWAVHHSNNRFVMLSIILDLNSWLDRVICIRTKPLP